MNCENIETILIQSRNSELSSIVQTHLTNCQKCNKFYKNRIAADQAFLELQKCSLEYDLCDELKIRLKKLVKEERDSKIFSARYDFLLKSSPKRTALIYGLASLFLISIVAIFISFINNPGNFSKSYISNTSPYQVILKTDNNAFKPQRFHVFSNDEGNFSKNLQAQITFEDGKVQIFPEDALIHFGDNKIELKSGKLNIKVTGMDFGVTLDNYKIVLSKQNLMINKTREQTQLTLLEGNPLPIHSGNINFTLSSSNPKVILHHEH